MPVNFKIESFESSRHNEHEEVYSFTDAGDLCKSSDEELINIEADMN